MNMPALVRSLSSRVLPAAMLGSVLLLAACDSAAPPGDTSILHRGNGPDAATLDPQRRADESSGHIVRDLFEGLVLEGPGGELRPGLATGWELLDEGRRIVFTLRDDAHWCNGDPVTAEDIVAGLQRAVDPATTAPFANLLAPIQNAADIIEGNLPAEQLGVEILAPRELEIRLESPSPWILRVLAHSVAAPVHRELLQEHGAAYARPENLVGNGAYCLADVQRQSHVRLDRNPHHWNTSEHAIDSVYFHTIEDLDAELARYRAGEIDITVTVAPDNLAWVKANLADELHAAPVLAAFYLGFNLKQPPFKENPELRHALNLALDREQLVNALFAGAAEPAFTLVPPMPDYTAPLPAYAGWSREQQLAEARRLYQVAGYSAEQPLEVTLMYPASTSLQHQVTVVASLLREALGVQVTLDNMEWKVFLATQEGGARSGLYRDSWIADFADPVAFLQMFASGDPFNVYGFSSKKYDALLAQASKENNANERMRLLALAEAELVAQDAIVPMYFSRSRHLVKKHVRGWQAHPLDHHATRFLSLLPADAEGD